MTPKTDLEFAKKLITNLELHSAKLAQTGRYVNLTPEMLETRLDVKPPMCAAWECTNLVFETVYCEQCLESWKSKKAI